LIGVERDTRKSRGLGRNRWIKSTKWLAHRTISAPYTINLVTRLTLAHGSFQILMVRNREARQNKVRLHVRLPISLFLKICIHSAKYRFQSTKHLYIYIEVDTHPRQLYCCRFDRQRRLKLNNAR
jgi:hypothetical protein